MASMLPAGWATKSVRERVDHIVDEFSDLEGREKLELLVDFAGGLPPLEPEFEARKGTEDRRVHECQTPVFLWTETTDGISRLVAEVAPEAPTVKGFVAILAEAVGGRPAEEVAVISDDMLDRMGLSEILGILRTRGLRAILSRIKKGFAQTGHG